MDLFSQLEELNRQTPLAELMRPKTLDEFLGQSNVVAPNSPLLNLLKTQRLFSLILWGTPGCGKTTLARLIAAKVNAQFIELSAVTSGVKEIKETVEKAREALRAGQKTILFIDEIHRYSKTQQDALLPHVENGTIFLIGSTTENPYIAMTPAIVSRCRIFEFKPLSEANIISSLNRAVEDKENGYGKLNVVLTPEAAKHYAWASAGDLRCALSALELAVKTTPLDKESKIVIDKEVASQSIQSKVLSIDENKFFDMLSAFCKSLRGSDAEAALFWSLICLTKSRFSYPQVWVEKEKNCGFMS